MNEDWAAAGPPHDCDRCPRLAGFRSEQRATFPDWFNGPVPSFGPADARLLIVGLAPGLRGANRTGRPFTGDYAGDLLYATLTKFGLTEGRYDRRPDDGFSLTGSRITNAVRCVPPENKPLPAEIAACRPYFRTELTRLPRLKALLALGQIAHQQVLATLGLRQAAYRFAHGSIHTLPSGLYLADSYHCSRYNTNTGRLTAEMFESVFVGLMPLLQD
ncbi:MAG: uracil-DNA glycosylase [Aliidongia sp.]